MRAGNRPGVRAPRPVELTTYVPEIDEPPQFIPTGNLWVSLSEIDIADGAVRTVGALIERVLGFVEATGGSGRDSTRATPADPRRGHGGARPPGVGTGEPMASAFHQPMPDRSARRLVLCPGGRTGLRAASRLSKPRSKGSATVELGWTGQWGSTTVTHLRSKPIGAEPVGHDDPWTGSRTVAVSAGSPLLSVSWQGGEGVVVADQGAVPRWLASAVGEVDTWQALTADLFVGVATEPDGAATTALHLRRRGFDAAVGHDHRMAGRPRPVRHRRTATTGGARQHQSLLQLLLRPGGLPRHRQAGDGDVAELTQYYVSAAFWSRDAYYWTFPALLLTDADRARTVLVSTIAAGGPRLADHALYLNGTSLYPGFELRPGCRTDPRRSALCPDDRRQHRPHRARGPGCARRAGPVDRAVAPSPVGPVRHLLVADR